MNPITHLLVSWAVAEGVPKDDRERRLITFAGVAPDLDGLGVLFDYVSPLVGGPATNFYGTFHHSLFHGVLGAAMVAAVALILRQRMPVVGAAIATLHLHLVCDLIGSRGPDPTDIWPIHYLAPFSSKLSLSWSHQWPLNGWPNVTLTVLLLGLVFARAILSGRSAVALFSEAADRAFVQTVQQRWRQIRRRA